MPRGAVSSDAPYGDGPMGIAAVVEDGNAARRAGDATSVAILRQLGLARDPLPGSLAEYASPAILDPRGERAGEVVARFRLS